MTLIDYRALSVMLIAAVAHGATLQLPGHTLPLKAIAGASLVEPDAHAESKTLRLAVRLPMRNTARFDELLARMYTPGDPLYGKYLSVEEFTESYGASEEDLERVATFFAGLDCSILTRHENRLLLDVECEQSKIERGLGIKISYWITQQGETIRMIDKDPSVPAGLAIEAILGLTSCRRHAHFVPSDPDASPGAGSGPGGGLSPSDIKTAYDFNGLTENGSGQTLALFELDGYKPSDIAAYQAYFHISPSVPLQNILVGGFNGSAGANAVEDTLDIELLTAIAPGASKILVYEGPNTNAGVIDVYQKIANDNLAKQVSTSWGIAEDLSTTSMIMAEGRIFMQMAAQGQAVFSASGDEGAFADGRHLGVEDPASQPYLTAAGGTTLTTNTSHAYVKETTWWNSRTRLGSGGGISSVWMIPSWQTAVITSASLGSKTRRNLPDVALDADPSTGYAVYTGGKWAVYGGTSCSAPIWSAFTSLVNQKRVSLGHAVLGFANPALYQVGEGANYSVSFHDIADRSTNGYYPAVAKYNLTTGWGTLNAANLLPNLLSP